MRVHIHQYRQFSWGSEFDKCENEHDLRDTGRAAADHIKELEAQVEYYRNQLIAIHKLAGSQEPTSAAGAAA